MRAKYCWAGNQMFPELDKELHFGFQRNGSLVVARCDDDRTTLTLALALARTLSLAQPYNRVWRGLKSLTLT